MGKVSRTHRSEQSSRLFDIVSIIPAILGGVALLDAAVSLEEGSDATVLLPILRTLLRDIIDVSVETQAIFAALLLAVGLAWLYTLIQEHRELDQK